MSLSVSATVEQQQNNVTVNHLGRSQKRQQRWILLAYIFMFLTIVCIVPCIMAYFFAGKINQSTVVEVWLSTHAVWIIRSLTIFVIMLFTSALWFIPLLFTDTWNASIWVTTTTVIGGFGLVASWLFLVNAWIKGLTLYFRYKSVY